MVNTVSTPPKSSTSQGCGQTVVILLSLVWLWIVPACLMMIMSALGHTLSPTWRAVITTVVMACLLLPPFLIIHLLLRRRPGWEATAATAYGLFAVAGYLTLQAAISALLADAPNWVAALRLLILIPYTLLVTWIAQRGEEQPLKGTLGLRGDLTTLLLAAGITLLITLPWPVTGALGDRYASLEITAQTFAEIVPPILLLGGMLFALLNRSISRTWAAAALVILTGGATIAAQVIPAGRWGMAANGIVLLPLVFLLTELRARGKGIYPLVVVAFGYVVTPRLFIDPRDAIAQGIPELQHILGFVIAWGTVTVVGSLLWAGRKGLHYLRESITLSPRFWKILSAATAAVLAGIWIGSYLLFGNPGFTDDGYLIILEEQAGLTAANQIAGREERIQFVYDTLVETAERTQAPLRKELEAMGLPYRPYYIINMIRVEGHFPTHRRFTDAEGVAQVIRNPNVRAYPHRIPLPYESPTETVSGLQENLKAIGVQEAWELGITGEGIVVAGQDTGYDWKHPALQSHYRGWDGAIANHTYNWHDAWDHEAVPFDDDSHGTHTMGTILGDDGGENKPGVAPGAQWIGCRNMRRGVGNPGSYAECMEYFLAPYPHDGNPFTEGKAIMAPHVINNSWGCPEEEGCFAETLEPAVEALRAAGIMMVVSAGNDGPACSTAGTPPANYDAVFSIGATDNGGTVTGFSSRGPVEDLLKPDVSAPGSQVRSSIPGGGYGYASGTSMAGPHVAGLVALLWSANPELVGDIDATEALICETATPKPVNTTCSAEQATTEDPLGLIEGPTCGCGGITGTPNNVYGCGVIDAGTAVQEALEP